MLDARGIAKEHRLRIDLDDGVASGDRVAFGHQINLAIAGDNGGALSICLRHSGELHCWRRHRGRDRRSGRGRRRVLTKCRWHRFRHAESERIACRRSQLRLSGPRAQPSGLLVQLNRFARRRLALNGGLLRCRGDAVLRGHGEPRREDSTPTDPERFKRGSRHQDSFILASALFCRQTCVTIRRASRRLLGKHPRSCSKSYTYCRCHTCPLRV